MPQLLRLLDCFAAFKFNVFHWHLTDDQGWRLEIPALPRLAEVSAWRGSGSQRHGGMYSATDVRALVAHAARLGLRVVPEIDLPGHTLAALAAYPELSCTGGPFTVPTRFGVFKDVLCAGHEPVYAFCETVLQTVLELFPGEWVHLGGDEVPPARWNDCPRCRAFAEREAPGGVAALQSAFLRRAAAPLLKAGRRIVTWDETLAGTPLSGQAIQAWRTHAAAAESARRGFATIVSPQSHCYLDYAVQQLDLRQAASFEPVPEGLGAAESACILGGEACLWTEYAPPQIESKLFPRVLGLAEAFWSPPDSLDERLARIAAHASALRNRGVAVGPSF